MLLNACICTAVRDKRGLLTHNMYTVTADPWKHDINISMCMIIYGVQSSPWVNNPASNSIAVMHGSDYPNPTITAHGIALHVIGWIMMCCCGSQNSLQIFHSRTHTSYMLHSNLHCAINLQCGVYSELPSSLTRYFNQYMLLHEQLICLFRLFNLRWKHA